MNLSFSKIAKQTSGRLVKPWRAQRWKRREADFISTQFSFWLGGDCVASWLWHWQHWLGSWCEVKMNWHAWTKVCMTVCVLLPLWGQGSDLQTEDRGHTMPCDQQIVPILVVIQACVCEVWGLKRNDNATCNLFQGELVLHPALDTETQGEWVLMLGGHCDTVSVIERGREGERERGEKNN